MEGQGKRWGGGWSLEGWGLGIDLHRQLDVVLGGVIPFPLKPGGTWHKSHRVVQVFFKGGIS